MSEKYILDNLKGQEIKELIVNRKMALEDLNTSALEKLLDYETDMLCFGEGDMDIIRSCSARLDELNGPLMSDEEFLAVIKKAEDEYASGNRNALPAKTAKRRFISKKIWIIAATVALLAAMATVTASAFGFNVFEYFKHIIDLPVGKTVDKGIITLMNNGATSKYNSIEDLLANENLNIMYPAVLPDDIMLKKVHVSEGANGGIAVQFITNYSSTYISVDTNIEYNAINDYSEKFTINGCTYYIFKSENFAVCYYNDCYYYISSDSYENLILIINDMRENK